jgi:glutathione S-transferase
VITLYGFGRVFPPVIGETRDLRTQWALEEMGLPYRVHGVDHTGGEHKTAAYEAISPFQRVPAIDDDGFLLAESGAVMLYLAEKYGQLIPADFEGRMRVTQWCFHALNTIEWATQQIQLIDKFGGGDGAAAQRVELVKQAQRSLGILERRLEDREWIACDDFTVADILLATVLRQIRKTELMQPYPQVQAYLDRALARPAWARTLESYAQRFGKEVAEVA